MLCHSGLNVSRWWPFCNCGVFHPLYNVSLFEVQRVLEHCNDLSTQNIIMDEIMHSICILTQDHYGNYVIHVAPF